MPNNAFDRTTFRRRYATLRSPGAAGQHGLRAHSPVADQLRHRRGTTFGSACVASGELGWRRTCLLERREFVLIHVSYFTQGVGLRLASLRGRSTMAMG